jgi:hypothetical protein
MASSLCEMTESKAHKFSLALPLVVPALVTPLAFVDVRLPGWLETIAAFIFASGIAGGVPYVVLVVLLFSWGRGKSDAQFKRALFLSPVLMLPVFFAFLVTFVLITQGFRDEAEAAEVGKMLLLYVCFILGFGYAYVLLVWGTVFVLKRLGVIAPAPAI